MNVVSRGVRNAFRNVIRTFSIVTILGISVGLALTMLIARQSVEERIDSVKSSIGNTITIAPAGVQGFLGGGELLTGEKLSGLSSVANVVGIAETLSDRLTSDTSNLVSAIEAGSFGNRASGNSGVGFQGPPPTLQIEGGTTSSDTPITRTFTPPIIMTGVSSASSASVYGGDSVTFTSGQAIDFTADKNEAVIGKALAEKNSLSVGSTFTMYGEQVSVVGIYDTGTTFANGGAVMSLASVQRLSGQTGLVSNATVTIDSVDNMETATVAVQTLLGDAADVTSNLESAESSVAPLESVKTISTYSLVGALIAGAVIILLTMMMIVRERRREIGVMKAIGSSNSKTMIQFMSEAVTLTVLGMVVGLLFGVLAANPVTQVLVNNSNSADQVTTQSAGPESRGGGALMRRISVGGGIDAVRDVQASVGIDIIAYAIGAALLISILGSAVPAYLISKIRPADVMRAE